MFAIHHVLICVFQLGEWEGLLYQPMLPVLGYTHFIDDGLYPPGL